MKLRIGTRTSKLAMAQANIVAEKLRIHHPHLSIEICGFTTTGDQMYDANLALIGGKGLFLKELEEQLLAGTIDIAVHSLKDVPAHLPEGMVLGAYLPRESPYDAFISNKYKSLADMPAGATLGTSSARRKAQISRFRPDLNIISYRGNIVTRLEKLDSGTVDACILAYAGLIRLGLEQRASEIFSERSMIPAVGQGIVCIEMMQNRVELAELIAPLNDRKSELSALAERSFLQTLDGDCSTPLGAYAEITNDSITMYAMLEKESGLLITNGSSNVAHAAELGERIASELLSK